MEANKPEKANTNATEIVRIQYMLNLASKYLLQIFKDRFKQFTGREWQDNEESGQYFLKNIDYMYGRNDKRTAIRSGESSQWDLSTLIAAIGAIAVDDNEKSQVENKHIAAIRNIRNNIFHSQQAVSLNAETFNQYFNELKCALVYFGEDSNAMLEIKTADINSFSVSTKEAKDPELEKLASEAETAMKSKQYSKAVDLIGKALALSKATPSERGELLVLRSDAIFEVCKQRKESNETSFDEEQEETMLNKALVDLRKARQLIPSLPSFFAKKGRLLYEMKQYSKAVKALAIAVALDPSNEALQRLHGEVKYEEVKVKAIAEPTRLPTTLQEKLAIYNRDNGTNFTEQTMSKLVDALRIKDDKGAADTMKALILMESSGAVPKYNEAFNLYMRAADKGNTEAMLQVGVMYSEGRGVNKSLKKAALMFEKLAKMPAKTKRGIDPYIANGQYCFGLCLLQGTGVTQDKATGIDWMTKAATNEDISAQYTLGGFYQTGVNVPLDRPKGFVFVKRAAEQGLAMAMDATGYCYATGSGVEKDLEQAKKWFQKAVDAGYHQAKLHLIRLDEIANVKIDATGLTRNQVIGAQKITEAVTQPIQPVTIEPGSPGEYLREIYNSISSSNSAYASKLQVGVYHAMEAFKLALQCQDNKKITLDASLKFVEHFAKVLRISEKLFVLPSDLAETIKRMIQCAQMNKMTEDVMLCHGAFLMFYGSGPNAIAMHFKKAIKTFPKSIFLHSYCSSALINIQQVSDSLKTISEAIKLLQPEHNSGFYIAQGHCYRMKRETQKAMEAFANCVKYSEPDHEARVDALFGMAFLCVDEKNFVEAEKYYTQAIQGQAILLPHLRNRFVNNPIKKYVEGHLMANNPFFQPK